MKMGKLKQQFINIDQLSQCIALRAERIIDHVPTLPGQSCLDVGSNNGAIPIHLSQMYGMQVIGINIIYDQIALTQRFSADLPEAWFQVEEGEKLPFPEVAFDIVSTRKTTHHIPEWEQIELCNFINNIRGKYEA